MATRKTATSKTTKPASAKPATKAESASDSKPARTAARQAGTAAQAKKSSKTKQPAPAGDSQQSHPAGSSSSAAILARAEEDMSRLLESLNTQMSAAMHAFEELAAVQRGRHEAVVRTRPLDRATAMFQRLVAEIVDDRFGELLPTLVSLREEMDQRARAEGNGEESTHGEFLTRGTEMLDQVLANAEVQAFLPKVGDAFDPLIHLAVGETSQADLPDGVVAESFQHGFRTARGKVVQAARVKVNRR